MKGKNARVFLLDSKSAFILSCLKFPSLYKHMQCKSLLIKKSEKEQEKSICYDFKIGTRFYGHFKVL